MATASMYLDKRRPKKDGKFPLKIRITHERKSSYFVTAYSMLPSELGKIVSGLRLSEEQRKVKFKLEALLRKAEKIIEELEPFNFEGFELRFTSKGDRSDLLFLLQDRADTFRNTEKHSSANLYQQASQLLAKYHSSKTKEKRLPISIVNAKWLRDFEKWAIEKEYSITTVGMYLIRVRTIFNTAIDAGELSRSNYPFGKKGYIIPKGNNHKRALTHDEIMQLYNYIPKGAVELFAKDIFMFSYLANGMNMYDIWKLRWSDIEGNRFYFIRKKTAQKTRGQNKIEVLIRPELQEIIDRHGSRKIGSDYIFNVLKPEMSAIEQKKAVEKTTTSINQALKKIAKKLGITEKISTYFARHSYATRLMNAEAPAAFISKSLGHSEIATTQSYLDSFSHAKTEEYQSKLLSQATP